MALLILEVFIRWRLWNPWVLAAAIPMKRLIATTVLLVAIGAGSRIAGLESEDYEQKADLLPCAAESYEAAYD